MHILKKINNEYYLYSDKKAELYEYSFTADGRVEQLGKLADALNWKDGRPTVLGATIKIGGLPVLDLAQIKSLVGETNVKDLAEKFADSHSNDGPAAWGGMQAGYIAGYEKCLEVNIGKRFTVDDMCRMIKWLSMSGKFLHAPTGDVSGNRPLVEEFMRTNNMREKTEWRVSITRDQKVINGPITIVKRLD